MLIYHPAFDLYHCMFRILLILSNIQEKQVPLEKILIWDYYVTFPEKASSIYLSREFSQYKKLFNKFNSNPYEIVLDDVKVFSRMRSYQMTAINNLISYNLLKIDSFHQNLIERTEAPLPQAVRDEFSRVSVPLQNVIKLIASPFNEIPLYGTKGFKYRTRLIDYKYDV